jgi:cation diffusion facilitator family transporter
MTLFAVRAADRPPDAEHPFGHGKIENLSALFETLLLLITALWIIYEAIQRLFFERVEVEPSLWGFLVLGISIAVDVSRSRLLQRTAEKYNSQALEADALHFRTDIWSSSVVILGLAGAALAQRFPTLSWMAQADSVAAIIVALIVIFVSGELGWRSIQMLIDTLVSANWC